MSVSYSKPKVNDGVRLNFNSTFESVDEILWCYHSNESSSAVLWRGTICFSSFKKMKSGILSNLATSGSEKKLLEKVP